MLEKLRNKFEHGYGDFEKLLHDHKDETDAVIAGVKATYASLDGHSKMEMAIAGVLQLVHVPAPIAILASDKLVDIVEKFIQGRYDKLKEAGTV